MAPTRQADVSDGGGASASASRGPHAAAGRLPGAPWPPLLDPHSYPDPPDRVTLIETQRSCLYVVGDRVFKQKKPLRERLVNLRTTDRRERHLREELRLNARMAPGVYLGLWGVVEGSDGVHVLPAAACQGHRVLDWLIAMRRLAPADCLLQRLRCRQLETADIRRLGRWLAGFYRAQPPCVIGSDAYRSGFDAELQRNREVLLNSRIKPPRHTALALDQLDAALRLQSQALAQRTPWLVEGHGDLQPVHVFLTDPPVAIDCLTFSAALRRIDPFDEIGYLGLGCDLAGARWIAPLLYDALVEAGLVPPGLALMRLYIAARALLHARLATAHLLAQARSDPAPPTSPAERHVQRALELLASQGPHGWP